MRKKIVDILMELGIPANVKGFTYICEAMEIYERKGDISKIYVGDVYREIAKKHETTYSGVERAIRYALLNAITYGNLDVLNKHMSAAQKHTNSNLLACLYLKLKES